MDVVVYVSVSVRVGGRCVVISFVRPPSVLRILSRSSYSLLGPWFLVVHVPSWRPVSCALEIAVHPVHSSCLEPGRSSSKPPLLWETFFLFSFFPSPAWRQAGQTSSLIFWSQIFFPGAGGTSHIYFHFLKIYMVPLSGSVPPVAAVILTRGQRWQSHEFFK